RSQNKTKKPEKKELMLAIGYFTKNINGKTPISLVISRYHRGWLYQQLGKIDKVEKDFSWLQSNHSNYADDLSLTLVRGQNFEKKGERKKANKIYMERLKRINDTSSPGLWLQVFRNTFEEKDCVQLLERENERKTQFKITQKNEAFYYLGRCYQITGNETKAMNAYAGIDVDSRYWNPVFDDHLGILKDHKEYKKAIRLLNEGLIRLGAERKEELLTNRVSFHQELKQWYATTQTIKELLELDPKKNKDPWLLLILAESYDALVNTPEEFEKSGVTLREREHYQLLALHWYRRVYLILPYEENRQRLSILNLLAARYESRGEYRQLIDLYEEALPLVDTLELRDDLVMRIARIYFDQLEDRDKARSWFSKLHLRGNREIHYEASSTLAEMMIEDGNYVAAIDLLDSLADMDIEGTPWYLKTHFRLAELNQAIEKWGNATLHYSNVATTINDQDSSGDTTYQSVHYRLGELYQIQENWELALEHYWRVVNSAADSDIKIEAAKNYKGITHYLQTVQAKKEQEEELRKIAEEDARIEAERKRKAKLKAQRKKREEKKRRLAEIKRKRLAAIKVEQKRKAAENTRKKAAAEAFKKSDTEMEKKRKKKTP
ncbi:MAG: cell envelope integrity protein TolA, partial [Proteobacteria bacterium]|nr:cell envelope integrity protein TolA [Pseudomonadota bacterium]